MKSKEELEHAAGEYQNEFPSGTARKPSYIAGYNAAREDAIVLAEKCVKAALDKAADLANSYKEPNVADAIAALSPSEIVKEVAG